MGGWFRGATFTAGDTMAKRDDDRRTVVVWVRDDFNVGFGESGTNGLVVVGWHIGGIMDAACRI